MRFSSAMKATPRNAKRPRALQTALLALTLAACATAPPPRPPSPEPTSRKEFRSEDFVVVVAADNDTSTQLAKRYLGDESYFWVIEDFNNARNFSAGQDVVIPLRPLNPSGVYYNGYQTVPILCYHRFGADRSKMVVAPEDFARQLAYLFEHGYRVVRMSDVAEFLQGKRALPRRSVVITMDDGYKSVYQHAYPLLQKYRYPATIFVYSDYVGAREGLTWKEMKEMVDSGLVDIQPHSKTHSNLGIPQPDEDEAAYAARVATEVSVRLQEIDRNLGIPVHTFAYPYGDTNKGVIDRLKQRDYRMAVTVQAGGNAAFAYPYMLQRSMVYGDQDIEAFRKQLDAFVEFDAP
jgi:peptidoglycan/xylan/chitin deacetylase (PgdA/CDA1 family)